MRRNWLEWAILIASVVSIVALVGFLAVEALRGPGAPDISIVGRPTEARQTIVGWEMPVGVSNAGREAAAAVTIEATASVGGQPETAEIVLDLLAPGTTADLVVGFSAPPDGAVTFRLVGYQAP